MLTTAATNPLPNIPGQVPTGVGELTQGDAPVFTDTASVASALAPSTASLEMTLPAAEQFKPVVSAEEIADQNRQVQMTYYKGPMGSFKFGFSNGKVADFTNFVYATRDPDEIKELDKEAKHIGLTKATGLIDVRELVDPTLAFKNKIIREYLREEAVKRVVAMNVDPGNSTPTYKVDAANTRGAITPDVALGAAMSAAASGQPVLMPAADITAFQQTPVPATSTASLLAKIAASKASS